MSLFHWMLDSLASDEEPVSLEEAKDYLAEESEDRNDLINRLIVSGRRVVETETWRQLMPATWKAYADIFPITADSGLRVGTSVIPGLIRADIAPITAVTQVQYVDSTGEPQILDPSQWQADCQRTPARIAPSYGNCWPATQPQLNAVTITVSAGYADAGSVPQSGKDGIMFLVSKWLDSPRTVGKIADDWREDFNRIISSLIWRIDV